MKKVDEKFVSNTQILNEHSQVKQNEFDNKEDGNKFSSCKETCKNKESCDFYIINSHSSE